MRLICVFSEEQNQEKTAERAYQFSFLLTQNSIENECEQVTPPEAPIFYRIWVVDEDQTEDAQKLYEEFIAHPDSYQIKYHPVQDATSSLFEKNTVAEGSTEYSLSRIPTRPAPFGRITIFIIAAAIILFIISIYQRPNIPSQLGGIPQAPNLAPIEKVLIYDYPHFFQLRDELLTVYTPSQIENNEAPSKEAKSILNDMNQTTYWSGFYDMLVNHLKKSNKPFKNDGPLFEKIRQGEVWRVVTPALLHFDLLHIFFNVLWFVLLGNQVEFRIGSFKYLVLIILAAIITNTVQYLMSGPFFLGLSGIVTTLAGFIFARQLKAPWEGYIISRMTLAFLFLFVIGMFVLQIVFFFLEVFGEFTLTIGIANSAHIAGMLLGFLIGQSKVFSIKHTF